MVTSLSIGRDTLSVRFFSGSFEVFLLVLTILPFYFPTRYRLWLSSFQLARVPWL
jgi:hypothetical protein